MTQPTRSDFKNQFLRDFNYSNDNLDRTRVMDNDIDTALTRAAVNFPCFFGEQATYNLAFLTLAAHHLCVSLGASSKGLAGQGQWVTQSRGVGSVNEAFAIPQRILDIPAFAMLGKTRYGMQFLEMCLPNLVAPAFAVGRMSSGV